MSQVISEVEADQIVAKHTAPKVTLEQIEALVVKEDYYNPPGTTLTLATLTLKNGYTVIGESAAASPENFNVEVGKSYAKKSAIDKVWALEGYVLRDKLKLLEGAGVPTGNIAGILNVATYVGTKVVHAAPMSRGVYNNLRGWELPADEDGNDDGYIVQYADGGATNFEGFTGYVSWSPKDVFEGSYSVGTILKQTNFLDRLKQEYSDLVSRASKLGEFLGSDKFQGLGSNEQMDLQEQLDVMVVYSNILKRRLDRLVGTVA